MTPVVALQVPQSHRPSLHAAIHFGPGHEAPTALVGETYVPSLDQLQAAAFAFALFEASTNLIVWPNGVALWLAPIAEPRVRLRPGVRLLRIEYVARPFPSDWALPIAADEAAFPFEHGRSGNGEYVWAIIAKKDCFPRPALTDDERERIACALAEELLREISP